MQEEVISTILEGFRSYLSRFQDITQGAKYRFEERDWAGIQADSQQRIRLYKSQVASAVRKVKRIMRAESGNLGFWYTFRRAYERQLQEEPARELAETFYNSICRKVIGQMGAHKDLMFVSSPFTSISERVPKANIHRFSLDKPLSQVFRSILTAYPFEVPFEDLERGHRFPQDTLPEGALYWGRRLPGTTHSYFLQK